jgi:protein kinase A
MYITHTRNTSYSRDQQLSHSRYLDILKEEFVSHYHNLDEYEKSSEDFDLIKTIGAGAFGIVFLVRDKKSYSYHAMKAIEKELIMKKQSLKQLLSEKKILQSVNFPFVISLDCCCKDNVYIYLISPFESGGEMYSLIKRLGLLSEPLAEFYASQIVLALEYLHHCCIIHRDVKPENIFLSESGYIKLGDFGFCKVIKTRTWTLCGTPEYLAPEIITSKGYSFPVDWWALGVLIYEMIAGAPPFYSSDPIKLYEKVLAGRFKTPDVMTPACKSLVKSLLEVDPIKRLGSLKAGVYDIKSHEWFRQVDWHAIHYHKAVAPYMPVCKNMIDNLNFREDDTNKLKNSPRCLFEKEFVDF